MIPDVDLPEIFGEREHSQTVYIHQLLCRLDTPFLFNFVFPLYINQYKRPKQKTSHSFRLRSTIVPAKPMIKHAVVVSPTPPIPGWSDVLMWPWHTEMGLGVGVQRHDFRPLDEYRGERGTYLRSGFTGLRRLFQATRTTNTQSTMF